MAHLEHEHAVMAEQCTGRGAHGVVCAAAPLAALAGADALRRGGNAFDAAVTAALCETVLLPPKCGFGGDLVAIVLRSAGDGARDVPTSLLAIGGAPAGLAAVARDGQWRDVGPHSVGAPAAAAGYAALAELATLDRHALAAPAIALATDGFPWATVCTSLTQQSADLLREMNPGGTTYLPGDAPIEPGTITRLPGLAAVIGEWAELGADLLGGPLGAAIVEVVQARGGVLTAADFGTIDASWVPCAQRSIGGHTVWATPPPTHGAALLAALTTDPSPAAQFDAVRRAITRRDQELADPSGTSIVSAADSLGNAVVVIHSNSYPRYGSGIVVPGYDLILANRAGRGFTPVVGHPNFPVAGRRPATTLHAWAMSDRDTGPVRWMGGTPGGANQVAWNAQTLGRLLHGTTEPGVLTTAPLWEALPSGRVRVEAGFSAADLAGLDELDGANPGIVRAPRWGCKSAMQVLRLADAGEAWIGAADPRTQGSAQGV